MATLITDAKDLPPGMIMLPGGREMRLDEFYMEYGDNLRPFGNAKIAVATPALHVPDDAEKAAAALVGFVVTEMIGKLIPLPRISGAIGAVVSAYIEEDASRWIKRHIDHGRIVRVYTICELFPSLDNQRAYWQQRGRENLSH